MRLNNKGQSLVLFVMIIPLLLIFIIFVIDIGNIYYEKRNLDDVNRMVLDYGIENIDDDNIKDKMIELFELNIDGVLVSVNINDSDISIKGEKYIKGIFSNIFNNDGYKIESYYSEKIDDKG